MTRNQYTLRDRFYAFSNPDMLHGPIFKTLVLFAIPVFLSMLFQNLYNAVDSLVVGRAIGSNALAAVGAGGTILELLIGFADGAGLGMSMVLAERYGAGDTEGMKKVSAACLVIGIVLSVGTSVLGLLFLEDLLMLLNTPPEIMAETIAYTRVIIIGIFACFFYNLFCGMLKALGNSFVPLLYLFFSSFLNIILDIFFVVTLKRGVVGAAEATVISQAVSAVLSGIYILHKTPILIPKAYHFKSSLTLYLDTAWKGIAMGLMKGIVMIGTLTLQYAINSLGTLTIAAHTAARKIYLFGTMPVNSIASSISMFASQNHGAKQYGRLKKALRCSYLFDIVYMVLAIIIFWSIAEPAMKLMTGSDSEALIGIGVRYLKFVPPFYLVLGLLNQGRFALQGLGKTGLPMVSSVIELVGKVIFTYIFVPKFGYDAVIVSEPIIWCLMAAQLHISLYLQPQMRKGYVPPETMNKTK